MLFHPLYCFAEGRLVGAEPLGGASEAACLRDGHERCDVLKRNSNHFLH
jgi:hypothetical protein